MCSLSAADANVLKSDSIVQLVHHCLMKPLMLWQLRRATLFQLTLTLPGSDFIHLFIANC
jgi:hypothetical protein